MPIWAHLGKGEGPTGGEGGVLEAPSGPISGAERGGGYGRVTLPWRPCQAHLSGRVGPSWRHFSPHLTGSPPPSPNSPQCAESGFRGTGWYVSEGVSTLSALESKLARRQ